MIREAWFIFKDGNHILGPQLKAGFGHVFVLFKDDFNWIYLAPDKTILKAQILAHSVEDNVPQLLAKEGMTVYKVRFEDASKPRWFPRILIGFSCVSLVKYFIGYKDYSITPYGLYKNLKKCKHNVIEFEEVK